MSNSNLYEQDFFAWANEQARLLRTGHLSEADIEHIAEEIESMGKTEKRELISRLKVLMMHLLKWRFQPTGRCTSWRLTIEEQRRETVDHLADNPSLKTMMAQAIAAAYDGAILAAARETGLDREIFTKQCPWSFEEITNTGFWPENDPAQ